MKVLYCVSEAQPFIASGGLGDVGGSLPAALRKKNVSVRVVLPLYSAIPDEMREDLVFIQSVMVPVAWRRQYCGILKKVYHGVTYYLLDNEYYFHRDGIYGHYDDAERFAFFSRAVLEIIPFIDFRPDVIHCNDWQTALTPVYYTAMYAKDPAYQNMKTVLTIHNIQYQGVFGRDIIPGVVGIQDADSSLLEYDNDVNFMKGGIECADAVTTVSPTYAMEIMDPWYSHGLDPILRLREWKVQGILNGIDCESYNPETDPDIFANYSAEKPAKKAENKKKLCERLGITPENGAPLVGIVSRLVGHKGFDLIKTALEEILCTSNACFAVLGSGETQYENFFKDMAAKYPGRIGLTLGFVPELARKIYAGSDIFLMPSKSEPCGLSQMLALRYGAIPVVRTTGGLKDSITDSGDGSGNGFTFDEYSAQAMMHALRRAIDGYSNSKGWKILVKRAMECDFSWNRSAGEYVKLYKALIQER